LLGILFLRENPGDLFPRAETASKVEAGALRDTCSPCRENRIRILDYQPASRIHHEYSRTLARNMRGQVFSSRPVLPRGRP
jgi:hypothetical protein